MKGSWFTLEAVIACIVIASFLIVLAKLYLPEPPSFDASGLAYDALKSLDDRGVLRGHAVALDYDALDSEVDAGGYNHTINICGVGGSCVGPSPNSTNIWLGSYFIAGKGVYKPLEVRLYLWK